MESSVQRTIASRIIPYAAYGATFLASSIFSIMIAAKITLNDILKFCTDNSKLCNLYDSPYGEYELISDLKRELGLDAFIACTASFMLPFLVYIFAKAIKDGCCSSNNNDSAEQTILLKTSELTLFQKLKRYAPRGEILFNFLAVSISIVATVVATSGIMTLALQGIICQTDLQEGKICDNYLKNATDVDLGRMKELAGTSSKMLVGYSTGLSALFSLLAATLILGISVYGHYRRDQQIQNINTQSLSLNRDDDL